MSSDGPVEGPTWREVLRHEFEAGDGSFLIRLRAEMVWDPGAFRRVAVAMRQCCEEMSGDEPMLERWLAFGFWYLPVEAEAWTDRRHASWRDHPARAEIDEAMETSGMLAYWFFFGDPPWGNEVAPTDWP